MSIRLDTVQYIERRLRKLAPIASENYEKSRITLMNFDGNTLPFCDPDSNHAADGDAEWSCTNEQHEYTVAYGCEVFVIYNGAEDETFTMDSRFVRDVAKWIADECIIEAANATESESWEITAYHLIRTEGDSPFFRVSSED